MAVSDAARNRLYNTIREHFGPDDANLHADTMMEMLPPAGWADVARQRDLDRVESKVDRLEDKVDREFRAITNRYITWTLGFGALQTAVIGLLVSVS